MTQGRRTAPLSPTLIAGLALPPPPPPLLQPILDLSLARLRRRHPGLFARFAELDPARFLIEPTDFPVRFLLTLGPSSRLTALAADADPEDIAARIAGPALTLVALLEGRLDGDALFFSRALSVAGETEAVVALRNLLDGTEICLADDLLSGFGPLRPPAALAWRVGRGIFDRAARDLDILRDAVVGPLERRCAAQAVEIEALTARLADVERKTGRRAT
ncbi:MAG: ubiquinone anaerobic biosynthesis accessory factor UbiT, partial [Alphaproteobacteria bacterium]